MWSRKAVAALLALLVLGVAACGDEDEPAGGAPRTEAAPTTGSSARAEPLPSDEASKQAVGRFRAQTASECRNAGDPRPVGRVPEGPRIRGWARRALPVATARVRILESARAPGSEVGDLRALRRDYARFVTLLEGVAVLEDGERERADAAVAVVRSAGGGVQRRATRLGVAACGPLA